MIYVNYLPSIIKPPLSISLFVDDTKISCTSTSLAEIQKLQSGLDAISQWMNTWKLELALPNCSDIRIFKSIKHHTALWYKLYILSMCYNYKDMGIPISNNLSFNLHINNICNRTYLTINMLFICFVTNDYTFILKWYIYIYYVRPKL